MISASQVVKMKEDDCEPDYGEVDPDDEAWKRLFITLTGGSEEVNI